MGNEFSDLPVEVYIRLSKVLGGNMCSYHGKRGHSEAHKTVGVIA